MSWSNLIKSVRPLAESTVVETLGWCLLHSLWQIALIAIAVNLLIRLINGRHSTARYAIALTGLFLVFVLPIATWFTIEPTERLTVANIEFRAPVAENVSWLQTAVPVDESHVAAQELSWTETIHAQVQPWLPVITAIWLIGICLFSIRPVFGVVTILQMKRRGTSTVPSSVEARFRELVQAMHVSRPIQIMQSSMTKIPMVIGFLKPMVLVPASSLTNLSASELDAILAHELAHLRRYDDVVNLLQTVVESVFFFHPGVWWMSGLVRSERENCCDDAAVLVVGGAKPLAQALLQLEQLRVLEPALSASGGSLVKRIRRLAPDHHRVRSTIPSMYVVGFVALVLACCFLGWTAEQKAEAITDPSFIATQDTDDSIVDSNQDAKQSTDETHAENPTTTALGPTSSSVKIVGDPETGTLTVVGEPSDIATVRDLLIRMFEKPDNGAKPNLDPSNRPINNSVGQTWPIPYQALRSRGDQPSGRSDPEQASTSAIIELIALHHRRASDIAETVSIMFAETSGMGKLVFTPDEPTNVLTLRGTQKNGIKYAKRLIKLLDVPSKKNAEYRKANGKELVKIDRNPRVYRLSYRNAKETTKLVNNAFEKEVASNRLIVVAEEVSNSIIVSAEPKIRARVEELIRVLDRAESSDVPKPLPGVRVSPVRELIVLIGGVHKASSDFPVAEITVDNPEIVSVSPIAPNQFKLKGIKEGVTRLTTFGPKGKTTRYKVIIYDHVSAGEKEAFKQMQSRVFSERARIEKLIDTGSVEAALRKAVSLRKSILDDKKINQYSKTPLLEIVERDISELTERIGEVSSASVPNKVTLEAAHVVELKHKSKVSEFVLSTSEVIEVKPISGTEFRVTGKKTGTCDLELIDEQGKVLARYKFNVVTAGPEL